MLCLSVELTKGGLVMVHLHGQLDETWNHSGDTHLSVVERVWPDDRLNRREDPS